MERGAVIGGVLVGISVLLALLLNGYAKRTAAPIVVPVSSMVGSGTQTSGRGQCSGDEEPLKFVAGRGVDRGTSCDAAGKPAQERRR